MIDTPWSTAIGDPFRLPFVDEDLAVPTATGAAKEEDGTAWLEEDGTVVSTE